MISSGGYMEDEALARWLAGLRCQWAQVRGSLGKIITDAARADDRVNEASVSQRLL